tara:strand:- start:998 stop:2083 length:1086 start_codon:yes stop_codon:yes gene_type:complete
LKNILLITKELIEDPKGGREQLNKNIFRAISCVCDKNNYEFTSYQMRTKKLSFFKKISNFFQGHIDGITPKKLLEIKNIIEKDNISLVVIDGSNYGLISKFIKNKYNNIQIISFYHNVETEFFLQKFKNDFKLKSLAVLVTIYRAERLATKFSDKRVCLNERDSKVLYKWFGKTATHIIPLSFNIDNYGNEIKNQSHGKYLLFVGGQFFGNFEGISWFVKNVLKKIEYDLVIVGKNMDIYKHQLEISKSVKVYGEQDSLVNWYENAIVTVAPIFRGSGMKTKIAESLLFGKKVVGTKEAFMGYENFLSKIGWECNSSEEFINVLNNTNLSTSNDQILILKKIFLDNFSLAAFESKVASLID